MRLISIIQLVLFSLGTIFLIIVSSNSLRDTKVHGFYRFFVFEFTFALVLLNFPHWFEDPFSFQHIVSWLLLLASLLLLVQSVYFFKKYGGRAKRKDSPANYEFENTVSLIKEGIYKYIRHPMYGSLLFLALGTMLKYISFATVSLAVITIIFLIFTARIEERENIKFFGSEYKNYMQNTRMFIPFVL